MQNATSSKRLDHLTAAVRATLMREQATPDEYILALAFLAASGAAIAGVTAQTLCAYVEATHSAALQALAAIKARS